MSSNYSKNLSEQIKQAPKTERHDSGAACSQLGVSYQAVSKWENEQSCPEITLLPLLADVFQISMDDLFGRTGSTVNLRNGLVAEYLFNGGAKDSSGNEQHGQVTGAVLCADRFGQSKPDPDEPMYLGRKASDEPYFFLHGKIDDVRI